MTLTAIALVLAAAVLHASWNAAAKRAGNQFLFIWLAFVISSLLLLIVSPLWWRPIPAEAWPYIVGTCILHAIYAWLLGRSYKLGDFSRVYPIARGLGLALVPLLAWLIYGEKVDLIGGLGIGLVVAGIAWTGLSGSRAAPGEIKPAGGRGGRWAVLTGLSIAAFQIVDRGGVQHLWPGTFLPLLMIGTMLVASPLALAQRSELAAELRRNWRNVLLFGPCSAIGYGLVLFAFTEAKTGYVVASREVSIIFSVLIGALVFGERGLSQRLSGALLIIAGVVLIAFAK